MQSLEQQQSNLGLDCSPRNIHPKIYDRYGIFSRIKIVLFEVLHPDQQFFSNFGTASGLSNGDEVSCSRTQHRAPDEDRTRDLAIKSDALPTELSMLPRKSGLILLLLLLGQKTRSNLVKSMC